MISQNFFQAIISWLLTHGIKVALILIAAFLVNHFLRIFIKEGEGQYYVGDKRKIKCF